MLRRASAVSPCLSVVPVYQTRLCEVRLLRRGRDENTLIDTFVFSGAGHEVRDVMVAGRWLVQEGRHSAETAIAVNYKRAMNRILE